METSYAYDGDGNISSLETRAGENVLLSFAYRYDGNGKRTAKTGSQVSADIMGGITMGNNALDISYRYDIRGQLLEEKRNGASVCYAYDKAGNRIQKMDKKGEVCYFHNEKNQLFREEENGRKKQFTYDRQGGIVEERNPDGIRLFSYNSRHQQTKVETESGSVQENHYDVENLRFELLENGRRTSFVYHNGELLHEKGGDENQSSYHLAMGIVAVRRNGAMHYYHQDEQLSTAFITGVGSDMINSYQYDAFGVELECAERIPNRIRYTGQQYDQVTGQYYLRARYYNPILGRFMQEDVFQGDGLNLYAYCHNNPVVYFDPSGYYKASGDIFTNGVITDKGDSTDLKIEILKNLTGDSSITAGDAKVGSHQAQHLIPNEFSNNAVISVTGYQVDHAENGILDINKNSGTPTALDDFLKDYTVSKENYEYYVSNNTHHGQAQGANFYHDAYNEYVQAQLEQLNSKYHINEMLETKSLSEIREQLATSGELKLLQKDILQLNNELRQANQEGIDLYLKYPNNSNIQDYTEGGTLSHEEAMKKYTEENFEGNNKKDENEESLKNEGCGGVK